MHKPDWYPIVVGVDASDASVEAARCGQMLAAQAEVPCTFVHAVPEVWSLPAPPHMFAAPPTELNQRAAERSAIDVQEQLAGRVRVPLLNDMAVRIGRPGRVLADAAEEFDAGLIVVGGKRHSTLGRWVAGSTAHAAVRTAQVPVLVATSAQLPPRRVLAAVDLSEAAAPTIRMAEAYAALFGSRLTVLHAIEPLPSFAEFPGTISPVEHQRHAEDLLETMAWPVTPAWAERLVLHGEPEHVVAEEVARRNVDLVVVGSHGRGWVDRILLGSVTERLLGQLPAHLLVVPIAGVQRAKPRDAAGKRRHREAHTAGR